MKTSLSAIVLLSSIFFFQCSSPVADEAAEVMEVKPEISAELTEATINHHLSSFGNNDLQEILADYTEESLLITPDSTFKGLKQIEGFFVGLLPAFPTEGTEFTLDKLVVENELAYILWHASTPAVDVPLGTDTFVIIDGKIMKQTFAGVVNPVVAETEGE